MYKNFASHIKGKTEDKAVQKKGLMRTRARNLENLNIHDFHDFRYTLNILMVIKPSTMRWEIQVVQMDRRVQT